MSPSQILISGTIGIASLEFIFLSKNSTTFLPTSICTTWFFLFLLHFNLMLLELLVLLIFFISFKHHVNASPYFMHHYISFTPHIQEVYPLLTVRITATMTVITPAIINCSENFVLFHKDNTCLNCL